jgi:uncharacterized protein YifE (UPF0438 family)
MALFKFIVTNRKFDNSVTHRVNANSFEQAKAKILNKYPHAGITLGTNQLPCTQEEAEFCKSVNPIQILNCLK